tara:strand:- start:8265 stop:8411 length:147 start_codon:yes stop_codon:yes gene_type:complete
MSVWTVHRVEDNHVVAVYAKEERAASWCQGKLEPYYYYEEHEVYGIDG